MIKCVENTVDRIVVRKDDFVPSRPWCADIYFKNGEKMNAAWYHFRTKKSLLHEIEAVIGNHNISVAVT